jgi:hypothetical protein
MARSLTTHQSLASLRDFFSAERILICFNRLISRSLISEIGVALKEHIQSTRQSMSSAMDVFIACIKLIQNIRHYTATQGCGEPEAMATVVIAESSQGSYVVSAGNVVQLADVQLLLERVTQLAAIDKEELKTLYKQQLRSSRDEDQSFGAGLGLIEIAQKPLLLLNAAWNRLMLAEHSSPSRPPSDPP